MLNEHEKERSHTGAMRGSWSWPLMIIAGILVAGLGYGQYSMNKAQDRIATLEQVTQDLSQSQAASEKKTADLIADLETMTQRVGVTASDLQKAREQLALRMKQQQEIVEKKLTSELATKANSQDVESWRQESTTKLAEVQQDANTKFGNVTGEVTGVKQDLATAKQDFNRQLVDVKNTLSDGIARNSTELAALRRKGERDYIEVELRKDSKAPFKRVGDIQLALTKTDPKRQKYNITVQVDDNRLEKKDRTTNEPVQFLVGRDQLRYELVINAIDKDRVRGYLSLPKDKVLSAEGPTFRATQ